MPDLPNRSRILTKFPVGPVDIFVVVGGGHELLLLRRLVQVSGLLARPDPDSSLQHSVYLSVVECARGVVRSHVGVLALLRLDFLLY